MGVLKSNLFNGAGGGDLEACAADHAFNFFQGKRGNAGREAAINRIRTALLRLGLSTADDGPGVYGPATTRAVLAYKNRPPKILGAGQKTPDAVVGRQTIVRLDKDILDGGHDDPKPDIDPNPTPKPSVGSRRWNFNFFADKGAFGAGSYVLLIISAERQDAGEFSIRETLTGGDLTAGFRGGGSGTFSTTENVEAKDFMTAGCTMRLTKVFGGGKLFGPLDLGLILPGRDVRPSLFISFEDQAFGESLTSGEFTLSGQLVKREFAATTSSNPSLSPSAMASRTPNASGIRALRRHTFQRAS